MVFNVMSAMKYLKVSDICFLVDVMGILVGEKSLLSDALQLSLIDEVDGEV